MCTYYVQSLYGRFKFNVKENSMKKNVKIMTYVVQRREPFKMWVNETLIKNNQCK